MPRKFWIHFQLVVEVAEAEDADDAWEKAIDILRDSGGDITGHTICDESGAIEESCP